jgi:hypothetical protein
VDDITPLLPANTVAFLRIADDSRRFPFRPMPVGLFLIGRGEGCDLRIGNDLLPDMHSVIQVKQDSAEIFHVAGQPPLILNGEPVRSAQLSDGDVIEVGDVRCLFRFCEAAVAAEESSTHAITPDSTAPELIAGMESELALIDALQRDSGDRLQDLLSAAQEAVDVLQFARTLKFEDYSHAQPAAAAPSTEHWGPAVLKRLHDQESRLDDIGRILEQVVGQQQLITAALQVLADRVMELHSHALNTAPGRRASA